MDGSRKTRILPVKKDVQWIGIRFFFRKTMAFTPYTYIYICICVYIYIYMYRVFLQIFLQPILLA